MSVVTRATLLFTVFFFIAVTAFSAIAGPIENQICPALPIIVIGSFLASWLISKRIGQRPQKSKKRYVQVPKRKPEHTPQYIHTDDGDYLEIIDVSDESDMS